MKALTILEFIQRAKIVHGDKYDYTKFTYTTWDEKSTITCKLHGDFIQKPRQHLERRSGCPVCGRIKQAQTKGISFQDFCLRAIKIHGDLYDYTNSGYTNIFSPITIKCKIHGNFYFKHAYAHTTNKNGCQTCAREQHRLTTINFINNSKKIHGDLYDYSITTYIKNNVPVEIICPMHGKQTLTPRDHYRVGCWICKRNRMQDLWLDELKIPNTKKHRQVRLIMDNMLHVVDGFDDKTNTAYLFHGDYWHGNPVLYDSREINKRSGKTFGELYASTLLYEQRLQNNGYNVKSIWEYEWLQQKNVQFVVENLD